VGLRFWESRSVRRATHLPDRPALRVPRRLGHPHPRKDGPRRHEPQDAGLLLSPRQPARVPRLLLLLGSRRVVQARLVAMHAARRCLEATRRVAAAWVVVLVLELR